MTKIKISTFQEKKKKQNTFEGYDKKVLTPQGKKLLKEWKKVDSLCQESDIITYIIRRRNRGGLPVEYEIIYGLKSIVGVNEPSTSNSSSENQLPREPIYGDEHHLSIILPNNYPSAFGGNPEFKMLTNTWHPNIRATGKFKGRICLNNKDLGVTVGLDERIIRVGKYLQYQVYWANESYPWPEDKTVAEWVREEAEPSGWINIKEGIFSDYSNLSKIVKSAEPHVFIEKKDNKKSESGDKNLTIKI
ncbi:MAG TPA: hypothetical protein QF480_05595 [Bacteroidales bacterium]|jgi:hypothetical protein|nr:hypothetical protein [Bacteroidales bacterium]